MVINYNAKVLPNCFRVTEKEDFVNYNATKGNWLLITKL